MKSVTHFLAAVAISTAAVELQADPATSAQSSTSGAPRVRYVPKQRPVGFGDSQMSGDPRHRLYESTSGNWSGYAVPLENSGVSVTFTSVSGSWVVPALTGAKGSAAYAATWVGLDGYTDGSVEQTGTLQEWTGSGQVNYPWFEMYPGPMYEIEGLAVNVGDVINATVAYVGPVTVSIGRGRTETESVFKLTISDLNPNTGAVNWTETVPTSYTTIPSAARSSAEWIMEAPTSGDVLPLADFGTDSFFDCGATGTSTTPSASWPFDPLTMIDAEGGESTPSAFVNGAFNVTWIPYTPPPPTRRGGR